MSGERNLERLLRHLAPELHAAHYVYCCFAEDRLPDGLEALCTFRETEGLTAIVERSQAVTAGVPFVFEARLITLTIHSSLEAIGLIAAVATQLAQAGIPCNAIAAYHHDHILVPADQAAHALTVLQALASGSGDEPSSHALDGTAPAAQALTL
ncbi:ACT domain-containing protein [Leptothrix sp. BB-4]